MNLFLNSISQRLNLYPASNSVAREVHNLKFRKQSVAARPTDTELRIADERRAPVGDLDGGGARGARA